MMFEILNQFMEKEEPEERSEWYGEYGSKVGDKYVMDEIKDILNWWNKYYLVEFPAELDKRHDEAFEGYTGLSMLRTSPEFKAKLMALHDFEQSVELEKLEMMKRLVDISPCLWT
jgi:hypothetical protein